MSIYALKSRFQELLRPQVNRLAARGATANQVTMAAVLLSGFGGLAITAAPESIFPYLLLPVILLVRMALNAADGMLAREHQQQSRLGAMLNEMGDVVSDTLLYLPFALNPAFPPTLIVAAVILSLLTEMAGLVAVQMGGTRRYDGPMGKSDRAVAFSVLGLAYVFGIGEQGLLILVCVLIALLMLTVVQRCRRALLAAEPVTNSANLPAGE